MPTPSAKAALTSNTGHRRSRTVATLPPATPTRASGLDVALSEAPDAGSASAGVAARECRSGGGDMGSRRSEIRCEGWSVRPAPVWASSGTSSADCPPRLNPWSTITNIGTGYLPGDHHEVCRRPGAISREVVVHLPADLLPHDVRQTLGPALHSRRMSITDTPKEPAWPVTVSENRPTTHQ